MVSHGFFYHFYIANGQSNQIQNPTRMEVDVFCTASLLVDMVVSPKHHTTID